VSVSETETERVSEREENNTTHTLTLTHSLTNSLTHSHKQNTQLELILITLKQLSDEIFIFSDENSKKRQKNLVFALKKEIKDILQFLKLFLEKEYLEFLRKRKNSKNCEINIFLLKKVLQTLNSYCEWVVRVSE